MNKLSCLRIIKVNYNRISIIPYLKNIQHLEALKNPVKLITSQISIMGLEFLDFDWLEFLVSQSNSMNRAEAFKKFKKMIQKIDFELEKNKHFVDFS